MRRLLLTVLMVLTILLITPSPLGGLFTYYYVVSGSMGENAPLGSFIVAAPLWIAGEPHIGDIVLHKSSSLRGRIVAHRLVGYDGGLYIISADVGGYTATVKREDVVGRAILVIPILGWLGILASAAPIVPITLILALLIPGKTPGGRELSLYPLPAAFSILPLIFPLRQPLQTLFAPYSGVVLTAALASATTLIRFAEKTGISRWLVDAAYIFLAAAAAAAVRLP